MFDYLRNLTKSAEEKQQEALNAYLDDALLPKERQRFEQLLARDADLRQEVAQRRALQAQMRQMPRRRVPRNFTLDPAVYGRPQRQPLFQLYPAMQVATVLTALFFILAIGADLFMSGGSAAMMGAPQDVAMVEEAVEEPAAEEPAAAAPLAAQVVEVTRIVTETVVEEGEAAAAEAAPMLEAPAAEEMAETADYAAEEAMPTLEASAPPANDTTTTDAAEATGAAGQEPAAAAPLPTAMPTASPAPQTALATIDATKSTVPRPEVSATAAERAITAVPEAANGIAPVEATAVPSPQPTQPPISGLRWLQIGLGLLLIVLGTAVFYVRRRTI
ncbi:MAG: hypothetical protein H6667_14295 [Ardenticatenaceae bacterium]|nr:hypothetical protein [Ardenticatenaceae bacterium]MCB9444226.1 hypothetical protein [Ardenticatenaceae bacterium]